MLHHYKLPSTVKKDGDYFEFGSPLIDRWVNEKEQWAASGHCKEGQLDDVPEDIRFHYYRTCKEIQTYHINKPDRLNVCRVWYWGPLGTGKSYVARAEFPGAYDKQINKWWDVYQMEDSVIIDDFDIR